MLLIVQWTLLLQTIQSTRNTILTQPLRFTHFGRFSVLAQKLCQNSFNRNICGNISRQWRAFLLAEIFHELFRAHMRIKVNILTRQSRVNMTQGDKTFGVLATLGVQRHMGSHSHNFVLQDTRWASSVGSSSREDTVRVVCLTLLIPNSIMY